MSMTDCHCSGFMRMTSVSRVIPALLINTSTVPKASTAALNMLSMSSILEAREKRDCVRVSATL